MQRAASSPLTSLGLTIACEFGRGRGYCSSTAPDLSYRDGLWSFRSQEPAKASQDGVGGGGRYIEPEIAQNMILDSPPVALAQLTPRDLEILRHLAAGKSLGEIADALGLGYKTIANNCSLIKTKLGVSKTSDLLRLAFEAGMA